MQNQGYWSWLADPKPRQTIFHQNGRGVIREAFLADDELVFFFISFPHHTTIILMISTASNQPSRSYVIIL